MLFAGLGLEFGAAPTHAGDLGGDCCLDLEERVAELEATTVRKGSDKVSFRLSGYYTQQVLYWNDGAEDDLYLSGLGPTQATNFRLSGKAQIAPGGAALWEERGC